MINIKKILKAILYTILSLLCSILVSIVTCIIIEFLKVLVGEFTPFLILVGVAIILCIFIYKEIL